MLIVGRLLEGGGKSAAKFAQIVQQKEKHISYKFAVGTIVSKVTDVSEKNLQTNESHIIIILNQLRIAILDFILSRS